MENINFVSFVENSSKILSFIILLYLLAYRIYKYFAMYEIEKELEKDYERFIRNTINFILAGIVLVFITLYLVTLSIKINNKNIKEENYILEVKQQHLVVKVSERNIKPKKEFLYFTLKKKLTQREFDLISNQKKQLYIAKIDNEYKVIDTTENNVELKPKIDYILKDNLSTEDFENVSESEKEVAKKSKNNYLIELPYEEEKSILYFIVKKYNQYIKKVQSAFRAIFVLLLVLSLSILYPLIKSILIKYWIPYTIFRVNDFKYVILKKLDDNNILATKYYHVKNKKRTKFVSDVYKFNDDVLNNQALCKENMYEISNRRNISMYNDSIYIKGIISKNSKKENNIFEIIRKYIRKISAIVKLLMFWIFISMVTTLFLSCLLYSMDYSIYFNANFELKFFELKFLFKAWLIITIIFSIMIFTFYIRPILEGRKECDV